MTLISDVLCLAPLRLYAGSYFAIYSSCNVSFTGPKAAKVEKSAIDILLEQAAQAEEQRKNEYEKEQEKRREAEGDHEDVGITL